MNMNVRRIGLATAVCSVVCLLAIACGGSPEPEQDAGKATTGSAPGEGPDPNTLYARIEKALDKAYEDLGKPEVNWDNMEKVKDTAFAELTGESAEPMWGASWSLSVLDDHIAVFVDVDGTEKSGEWRP
jgi:hypothetical protein